MASLYKKVINGKPYYYLRQMGRVDGKVTMISERYLGSVADIAAAMSAAEAVSMPDKTRNLRFGDVAAVWSMLTAANREEPGHAAYVSSPVHPDAYQARTESNISSSRALSQSHHVADGARSITLRYGA